MHCNGFDVGPPGKRERRLNTGNGSNKFTDNARYFWTFRRIVIEHKFYARTMGNYAVYSIILCRFPADCRLPVKEMDSSIQRLRVVQ